MFHENPEAGLSCCFVNAFDIYFIKPDQRSNQKIPKSQNQQFYEQDFTVLS
jgi:hypothetical protein